MRCLVRAGLAAAQQLVKVGRVDAHLVALVFQRGDGWRVFIVDRGRARVRQVEVGHRTGASVEIVRGLTPGMTLVLFPSDKIDDGVRVRSRESGD